MGEQFDLRQEDDDVLRAAGFDPQSIRRYVRDMVRIRARQLHGAVKGFEPAPVTVAVLAALTPPLI